MRRRELLKGMTAAAAGMYLTPASPQACAEEAKRQVEKVYVLWKCHLDIGYTNTEHGVIRTYFDEFLPRAIDTAQALRASGGEQSYVWTMGTWMIYEYLEQASTESRKRMERAIIAGDIAWHAIPLSWNSEMLDRSLIVSSLGLSAALDRRFGKKTIAGKLTDVPCHTRGLIGPLAEAGVRFLDIGNNPKCKAPDVPYFTLQPGLPLPQELQESVRRDNAMLLSRMVKAGMKESDAEDGPKEYPFPYLFNWRDPQGAELMVLYHPLGYGSTVAIPGTRVAVSIQVRQDNSGPHTLDEINAVYASLHALYPEAQIVSTNLSAIASALEPVRSQLPVVTKELGDTWIYGVGADPCKVARYRELCRMRREWLAKGTFKCGDALDLAFASRLILAVDHNWGLSVGRFLRHPEIYSPKELATARLSLPEFKKMDACWVEKRADIDNAVAALPDEFRKEAVTRLHSLAPNPPHRSGLAPFAPGVEVEGTHLVLSLDPATGSINRLKDRKTGREWASTQHQLACFRYQTYSAEDFGRFTRAFNSRTAGYDFSKPGMDKYAVQSRTWLPIVQEMLIGEDVNEHRIVSELRMPTPDAASADLVGWPERLTMEIRLPKTEPVVHIAIQCFNKPANRLAEAMWLSFSPEAPDEQGWLLDKVDRPISPHDVIAHGGLHLHAVTRNVTYRDPRGSFTLETLDAPLVSPGQRGLLIFDDNRPDMHEGVHVNLFNNLWGTAFPQWYSDDMQFRFTIAV
jgi:hypothetical protein